MRIYIFKSDAMNGLRAFTGDPGGNKLPERFRPWHVIGVIAPERDPPHKLPREDVEKAINAEGFKLWRMKASPATAS